MNALVRILPLAALLLAASLDASIKDRSLASTFPRNTLFYYESWVTPELRESMSRETLGKEGVDKSAIDSFFGYFGNTLGAMLDTTVDPASAEELANGIEQVAFALADVAVGDKGSIGDFVQLQIALRHKDTSVLRKIFDSAMERGSPQVVGVRESMGARVYQWRPALFNLLKEYTEGVDQGLTEAIEEGLSSFSVELAIVSPTMVLVSNRKNLLEDSIERAKGEFPEDENLSVNPRFKTIRERATATTDSLSYLALDQVSKLVAKLPNVQQYFDAFEINDLAAYGGVSEWNVKTSEGVGLSWLLFNEDKLPGWLKALQGNSGSSKLLNLMPEENHGYIWSGVGDLTKRMATLVDYVKSRSGMLGNFGEALKKGEMDADFKPVEDFLACLGNEQIATFQMPGDLNEVMKRGPNFLLASDINKGFEEKATSYVTDSMSEVTGEALTEEVALEGARVFHNGGGARYLYLALSNNVMLFGTRDMVAQAMPKVAAGLKDQGEKSAMLMHLNYGELVRSIAPAMEETMLQSGSQSADVKMIRNAFDMLGTMQISLRFSILEKQVETETRITGMPSPAQIARFVHTSVQSSQVAASEANLSAICNAVKLGKVWRGGASYPETLQELVEMDVLEAATLTDPLDSQKGAEASSYIYVRPPSDADDSKAYLVAYHRDSFLGDGMRLIVLLTGQTRSVNQPTFEAMLKLAKEGKPVE